MKLEKSIKIYRAVGGVGLILVLIGILQQFLIFPLILKSRMRKEIALKDGWNMRKIWSKLPFSYETHFYVFNITNYEEIGNGAKPIVNELGPYIYDVWQEKVNQHDYEEDDSVSYSVKRMHKFNPIKSKNFSDEDQVIVPDFLKIAAGPGFYRYEPAFVFGASKGIDVIYNKPEHLFINTTVKEVLFVGLPIPCKGQTNYFAKSICNELTSHLLDYGLRNDDLTLYTSVWGHYNITFERERKLRIRRGIRNIKEVGQVLEYEDSPEFVFWKNDSYCNAFHGTDGTILRPFLNRKGKDDIEIVNTFVCRSLVYHYDSTVEHDGLPLLRYTTHFGINLEKNPKEKCFCANQAHCLPKPGVLDLILCTYVPWVGSHPHFYLADQSYVDAVDGVHPDKEKHMMIIDIDPLTGIIVRSHMRIQFNYQISKLSKYRLMHNAPEAMIPVAWVDEIIIIPNSMIKIIKRQHNMVLLSQITIGLITLGGVVMCAVAGFFEHKFRKLQK